MAITIELKCFIQEGFMKKIKWGVALLLICFLFCSCGNTNNNNPAAEGAAQPATETASPGEEQKTDTPVFLL